METVALPSAGEMHARAGAGVERRHLAQLAAGQRAGGPRHARVRIEDLEVEAAAAAAVVFVSSRYSSRRRILPTFDLGSVSRNTNCRGTL